jgi:hypothetical protein
MADLAPGSHVIAERYLTSPAALAALPFGPVDALDTGSGRGAQVRIVFVAHDWDEGALAAAVARWCAIGCAEVCGVLDFGRHEGRWFLVLPPSLGLPVERWRMLRRPGAADAARLALAFGRLAERVAAAGFAPDAATLADVAVGPGPTPFLERPLLQPSGAGPGAAAGGGQHVLAAVCEAALGAAAAPADLGAWIERARAGGFESLAECLGELERCGAGARDEAGGEPPGLELLFDEGFDLDGPGARPPREPRGPRLATLAAVAVALGAAAVLGTAALPSGGTHPPARPATAAATPRPAPLTGTSAGAHRPATAAAGRRRPSRPSRTVRTPTAPKPRRPASTTAAAATATTGTTAPASTSSSGSGAPTTPPAPGGVTLPAPGGTTLPAP